MLNCFFPSTIWGLGIGLRSGLVLTKCHYLWSHPTSHNTHTHTCSPSREAPTNHRQQLSRKPFFFKKSKTKICYVFKILAQFFFLMKAKCNISIRNSFLVTHLLSSLNDKIIRVENFKHLLHKPCCPHVLQ